jgi:predicted CXXCH cytochrome family protein
VNTRIARLFLALLGVCSGLVLISSIAFAQDESDELDESNDSESSESENNQTEPFENEYMGSRECLACHRDLKDSHEISPHTQTFFALEDGTVLADFSQGEDLRTVQFPSEDTVRPFTLEDVAFVMGAGKHVQRYIYEEAEGKYRVFPAEWDVATAAWTPFTLADDWLNPAYDWNRQCAGCHTTGFDPEQVEWIDEGVQCEACHGPGLQHVELIDDMSRDPSDEELAEARAAIVLNPSAEICGACHSRGSDTGDGYAFPVGYVPGVNSLAEADYTLISGSDPVHWWATGHARQSNMQFNEWTTTGHASSLTSLLSSDQANDTCLKCHSGDYALWQKKMAIYEAGDWEGSAPVAPTLADAQSGITCSTCHNPHSESDIPNFVVDETYPLCTRCHQDTNETDGIHHPVKEMFEGLGKIDGIEGIPSSHFTIENNAECTTCHMPAVSIENDGTRASHSLTPILHAGENSPPEDTCTTCHTDLDPAYMADFVAGTQEAVTGRLEVLNTALEQNPDAPVWVGDAITFVEGDGSLGVHNFAYTDALLSAAAQELGVVQVSGDIPPKAMSATNPADCQECHRDEVHTWENSPHANASLKDAFLNEFAAQGRPDYCMSCHASGYDPATGTYQFEGVVCTSCHIIPAGTEHPPAPIDMGTDSTVCAQCHSGAHAPTYDEWLVSDHSLAGVDCADCHTPHDNGFNPW